MKNPSKLSFKKQFDEIAGNYDNILNKYSVERRSKIINSDAFGLVLEVGAGSGLISDSIKREVICTDFSFNMCKQAKNKHKNVLCCDAEFLPFQKKIFDMIISPEMIYYLEKPQNFIEECYSLLKKNGKICLTLPNDKMSFVHTIRLILHRIGFVNMYFEDKIKDFMDINYLRFLLEKNNFKIYDISNYVIFPFNSFDKLNKILEKSFFKKFAIFFVLKAISK